MLLHWAASQVTLLLEEVTELCRELLLPFSPLPCPIPFVFHAGITGRRGVGFLQGCGSVGATQRSALQTPTNGFQQNTGLLVFPWSKEEGMQQLPGILQGCSCRLIPLGQLSCVTCCRDQRLLRVGPRVERDSSQKWTFFFFQAYVSFAGVSMLELLWFLVQFLGCGAAIRPSMVQECTNRFSPL